MSCLNSSEGSDEISPSVFDIKLLPDPVGALQITIFVSLKAASSFCRILTC